MKHFLLRTAAVASTLTMIACSAPATDEAPADETSMEQDMQSKVVATVNGEEVTRAELTERIGLISQGQGQIPAEDVVLNQLIEEKLVFQDADAKGIAVDEEELNEQYDIVIQNAGGAEALKGQLSQLNLSPSALRKDLETQMLIQKYLESEVDLEGVAVSDAEIQTAYDEIAATQEVPPLDDNVREQIRVQLVQQKNNERVAAHVAALRDNADVSIMLEEEKEMEEDEEMEDGEQEADTEEQ